MGWMLMVRWGFKGEGALLMGWMLMVICGFKGEEELY